MASGNSREITTSQVGIHDKLDDLVKKYQASENKRPISDHTQAAFDDVSAWLDGFSGEIILDSCCGVGESTANIARANPDARVIGIDKSALRWKAHNGHSAQQDNYRSVRADVKRNFWRLVKQLH